MDRIATLESQVQALAAAWLHLAAQLEMNHELDRQQLTGMLRTLRIESMPEYKKTLGQLCDELDCAAESRTERLSHE